MKKILFLLFLAVFSAALCASPVMNAKKIFDEGRYEEARIEFEKIAEEAKEGFNYLMSSYYIARCFEEENNFEKALEFYNNVMNLSDKESFLARSAQKRIDQIKKNFTAPSPSPKPSTTPAPASTPAQRQTSPEPARQPQIKTDGGITYYKVKPNDSLSKIAQAFYGNFAYWNLIQDYNNMPGDIIRANQTLKIPPLDELKNYRRIKTIRAERDDEKMFNEALNYYAVKETEKARELFLKLSVITQNDDIKPRVLYYLGHINFHNLNFSTALEFFKQLFEFYPENDLVISSLYHITLIHANYIKDDEAFDYYLTALKEKDTPERFENFIETLKSSGYSPLKMKRAAVKEPKNIKAGLRRQNFIMNISKIPPLSDVRPEMKAAVIIENQIEIEPQTQPQPQPQTQLGRIRTPAELIPAQTADRERDFTSEPRAASQIYDFNVAPTRSAQNKIEDTKKRAELYKAKGMVKNAVSLYEKAYADGDYDGEILNNLSYMYAKYSINLSDALDIIDKALDLNDNFKDYYYSTKGYVLYRLNRLNKAREYILLSLETRKTPARHYHLALVQKALGDKTAALDELNKARLLSVSGGPFYEDINLEIRTLQK